MGEKVQVGNTFIPASPIYSNPFARARGTSNLFEYTIISGMFLAVTLVEAADVDDIWQVQ
jgi:hypothetical protein